MRVGFMIGLVGGSLRLSSEGGSFKGAFLVFETACLPESILILDF